MSLKLFSCGDVVNFTAKKDFVDDGLKEIIQSCDLAVCNFEAPINTEKMIPIAKAGSHIYQHPNSPQYLAKVGFTHVSLANNHIYDYGESALKNTLNALRIQNIDFIGAGENFKQAYDYKIIKKNNIQIGLLAACENEFGCLYESELERSGYAWLFHTALEDKILELKEKVNYVILIAHAGVEDIPIPIKEWRDRYQRLCDLGVNVIIGHHPHVPQGFEFHKSSLIFYSLGNFYFDTASFEGKSDDSYSILLNFTSEKIEFEIIYHKKINGITTLVKEEDTNFSIETLNSMLHLNYLEKNNQYALSTYNSYYKNYYRTAARCPISFKGHIKNIIKKILGNDNQSSQGLLLLHNIRIDSHRFTVQRALSLKYEVKP